MAHERIEMNPAIMGGKPVIKGTRMTVEISLRLLSERHSVAEILEHYPYLDADDIYAAQAFAADSLSSARFLAAE
ncbi:MAG: DUF433 domain-containing protein [Pseudomonadota bacterium]